MKIIAGIKSRVSWFIREFEHQVGRVINMFKIRFKIGDKSGDIIEFGTYQGLSLIILSVIFNNIRRKAIGIDCFEGLPVASTIWRKGLFSDTSLEGTQNRINKWHWLFNKIETILIKKYFNDTSIIRKLKDLKLNPILIHFDADLGISTTQALMLIEPFLVNIEKPIYFLFDDWGCHPDEVPKAFYEWVGDKNIKYTCISKTKYTQYFKIWRNDESNKKITQEK